MSQSTQQAVACPECGAISTATLWQSVNVTLNPELKEQVFSRELFEHTCPQCGETTHLFYPLLYHDQDRHLLIWMLPPDERGEVSLDPLSMNAQAKIFPTYRLRLVASLNALLEKIMIFDAGLDDRAVELLKELLWQDGAADPTFPRELFFFSQVVVDTEGARHLEMVQLQPPNERYAFRVTWDKGYQVVLDLLHGDYGIPRAQETGWRRVDHTYAKEILESAH